jgi:flavin-dependent dehydrogenase
VTTPIYDAVVIGAGPGGSTAALLLARAGWSVALVEKTPFPRRKVCGEFLSATNLPLLRELGVADAFNDQAGPDVRQVGLYAGNDLVTSAMPGARADNGMSDGSGRALGREHLDTLLLERAAAAGARVWQPWSVAGLTKIDGGYLCELVNRKSRESRALRGRVVIAAHGSWETGPLPTQPTRLGSRPSDLFGFKAHFVDSQLPAGVMPLLVFPGGYGGMVHSDHGRVSISGCIRRDQLTVARRTAESIKAAEAVLAHVMASCRGVREALAGARLDQEWMSTGPIRPGIRRTGFDRVFLVGNAAGEAHPAIAEGIGMAMQSAWHLCTRLITERGPALSDDWIATVQRHYALAWRRAITPRIRAAAAIAHWAMRPAAVACGMPIVRAFPGVLTFGARVSGKVTHP